MITFYANILFYFNTRMMKYYSIAIHINSVRINTLRFQSFLKLKCQYEYGPNKKVSKPMA